jgi:hypothetical protein
MQVMPGRHAKPAVMTSFLLQTVRSTAQTAKLIRTIRKKEIKTYDQPRRFLLSGIASGPSFPYSYL